jgi:hypothetical protein
MRALRTVIVALLISLGFLGGYFVGWYVHGDNVGSLTSSQQDAAAKAGELQQRVIEELQSRYYRPVDVSELSQAGVDGALETLDDPYTVYLTPRENRQLQMTESGQYSASALRSRRKTAASSSPAPSPGRRQETRALGPVTSSSRWMARPSPTRTWTQRWRGSRGRRAAR